jgi:hypothetical protein
MTQIDAGTLCTTHADDHDSVHEGPVGVQPSISQQLAIGLWQLGSDQCNILLSM